MSALVDQLVAEAEFKDTEIERLRAEVERQTNNALILQVQVDALTKERDRLYDRKVELARRLETAEQFFADRPARRSECHTLDDWRLMAEHYEYQWSQCSSGFNACVFKTIERCAEVCDSVEQSAIDVYGELATTAHACAAAIRALKGEKE